MKGSRRSVIPDKVHLPAAGMNGGGVAPSGVDPLKVLEIQRDLALELLAAKDLRVCLDLLLASAMRLAGFDCGGIYLLDEVSGALELVTHHGLSAAFVAQAARYPADTAITRQVLDGTPVHDLRCSLAPEMSQVLASEGLEAFVIAPLRDRGRVIAALNVSSHRHSQIDLVSRVALEHLVALGEVAISSLRASEAQHDAEHRLRQALESANAVQGVEQELQQSGMRFRELIELAADGILLGSPEGIIIGANAQMQRLTGRCIGELMGLHGRELFDPEEIRVNPPMLDLIEEARVKVSERNVLRPDGIKVPVEIHTKRMPDRSYQSIFLDVTARRKEEQSQRDWAATLERMVAERTLEVCQSEARCKQLAEATFEGITISEDGVVLDGNSQLAEMFGYELEEMIGRSVLDFVVPEARPLAAKRIRTHDDTHVEHLGLRKDGSTFPVEARTRVRKDQGRVIRVTALRDLSEIRAATVIAQAQRAELEATQRLALVSEISAGIIHQIGQPLSSLGANVEVAIGALQRSPNQDSQLLDLFADISSDVSRMRDIVIQMRALGAPEGSERIATKLTTMLADVLPLLRPDGASLMVRVQLDLDESLPAVAMNSVQMGQVVLNLVRNAFAACADCPPERRVVTIGTRTLDTAGVELSVRDAGCGLTPDALKQMFSPYFTTKADGLGLGLRICRTIVNAHGGTLSGENNEGHFGATFRVVLPVV